MEGFAEGYSFFEKNSGSYTAAAMGDAYVCDITDAIGVLRDDMNAFNGFNTKPDALKGDIAEFWHSDTFNINAIVRGSKSRTYVNRSHDLHQLMCQVILERILDSNIIKLERKVQNSRRKVCLRNLRNISLKEVKIH